MKRVRYSKRERVSFTLTQCQGIYHQCALQYWLALYPIDGDWPRPLRDEDPRRGFVPCEVLLHLLDLVARTTVGKTERMEENVRGLIHGEVEVSVRLLRDDWGWHTRRIGRLMDILVEDEVVILMRDGLAWKRVGTVYRFPHMDQPGYDYAARTSGNTGPEFSVGTHSDGEIVEYSVFPPAEVGTRGEFEEPAEVGTHSDDEIIEGNRSKPLEVGTRKTPPIEAHEGESAGAVGTTVGDSTGPRGAALSVDRLSQILTTTLDRWPWQEEVDAQLRDALLAQAAQMAQPARAIERLVSSLRAAIQYNNDRSQPGETRLLDVIEAWR